ncbi:MAG: hypothetical protein PVH61_07250 [Candidatus Aminicenantes bacterium]|jgi:hypothetical protein
MKNLVITFLAVCLAVSLTFIYKIESKKPLRQFPTTWLHENQEIENPLFLILYFSIQNCKECLGMIEILNQLNAPFVVYGIVPPNELKNEQELRRNTGAAFRLLPYDKFNLYAPIYAPTLMGVSKKGHIHFIIPGLPDQAENLENFIITFYNKAYPLLSY